MTLVSVDEDYFANEGGVIDHDSVATHSYQGGIGVELRC